MIAGQTRCDAGSKEQEPDSNRRAAWLGLRTGGGSDLWTRCP